MRLSPKFAAKIQPSDTSNKGSYKSIEDIRKEFVNLGNGSNDPSLSPSERARMEQLYKALINF